MTEQLEQKKARLVDGEVHCECGSTRFKYEENHPSERTMASNEDGALVFHSEFEWYDGDNDPGVVCDQCGSTIQLPENVEIDWT